MQYSYWLNWRNSAFPFNRRSPSPPPHRDNNTAPVSGSNTHRRQSGAQGKSKTFVCSIASATSAPIAATRPETSPSRANSAHSVARSSDFAAHKQRLPLVAGNTLTKGIEVVDCNGYDLARRHTPFCRVELRHRRELSQSNKTSSFRAAAPRGAATLHRTMMSIFSHNGTA